MNAAILTNEFPPEIYGGAGIHVKFLTQELSKLCHIEARCFGSQDVDEDNVRAIGFSRKLGLDPADDRFQKIFKPLDINLQWAATLKDIAVFLGSNYLLPVSCAVNSLLGKLCDTLDIAYSAYSAFDLVALLVELGKLYRRIVCDLLSLDNAGYLCANVELDLSVGYVGYCSGNDVSCI